MAFLKRVGLVLCTAYILAFFSEYLFVNEGPAFGLVAGWRENPAGAVGVLFELSVWYGIAAYFFLWGIVRFGVRGVWGLVLAGAIYGFLTEGVVVSQMYEGLPFTISWTALGWHVLIDVLIGWYMVRWVLMRNVYWQTAVMAVGLGAFWGVWATWYGGEEALMSAADFTVLALVTGGAWVLVNFGFDYLIEADFEPTRWGAGVMGVLTMLFFVVQILLALPWAVLVLPPLLVLTVWGLWRGRSAGAGNHLLGQMRGRVHWSQMMLLGLMPLTAVVVYPFSVEGNFGPLLVDLLVPLLMVVGFVVYGVGFWKTAVRREDKISVEG